MNQRIDELRTSLRDDPGSRLFFQLGDLLRKAGESDEAAQVLSDGLEHHPRYVAAWVSLGRIQPDRSEFPDAERSFARALELDPENAVAARLIGETAERAGEWVRAIKAYKLARALSPRDPDLEARIEVIERRLAGEAEDTAPISVGESLGDAASGFPESGFPVQPLTPPEPLPLDEPAPEKAEAFVDAVPARPPREVISISEDDPFAVTSTGDTGVWMVADDVFVPPETSIDRTADDVFGDASVDEPLPSPEPGPRSRPSEEKEGRRGEAEGGAGPIGYESGRELRPGRPPVPESVPEPIPEPESDSAPELPLPTLTLARLALEQNDRPLAEETLLAVLERDPANREAADLLENMNEDMIPEMSEPPSSGQTASQADLLVAKASRLKGWMENIRAAAERRAP